MKKKVVSYILALLMVLSLTAPIGSVRAAEPEGEGEGGEEGMLLDLTEIFPDENFRKVVAYLYDYDKDGYLNAYEQTEIADAEYLFLQPGAFEFMDEAERPISDDDKILDLDGIIQFGCLTNLNCEGRGLQSLYVGGNYDLEFLNVADNELTELDLSGNDNLTTVYCYGNEGLTIDLGANKALCLAYATWLAGGSLVEPNLGYCAAEFCDENGMFVSGLYFPSDAQISCTLDLDALLAGLECDENFWYSILGETYDTDQDGTLNEEESAAVKKISLSNNVSVSKLVGLEKFPNLEELYIEGWYELKGIILSGNTKLKKLDVTSSSMKSIDLSNNRLLQELRLGGDFEELDLSNNTALTSVDVYGLKFDTFSVAGLTNLKKLWISDFTITEIDGLDELTGLEELNISGSDEEPAGTLNAIDVSNLTGLKTLYIWNIGIQSIGGLDKINPEKLDVSKNKLTSLDVSHMTNLKELSCYENNLTSLKVGTQTFALLAADENQLQGIDGFENISVTGHFGIGGNPIGTLDVSRFTGLKSLYCDHCGLNSLNLGANTALQILECAGNALTELDLTNNTDLFYLVCFDNRFTTLSILGIPELLKAARGLKEETTNEYNEQEFETITYRNGAGGMTYYGFPLDRTIVIDRTVTLSQGDNPYTAEEEELIANFPDPYFRLKVLDLYDENYNGLLDADEYAAIAEAEDLYVYEDGIKSLEGIKFFTAIETLDCDGNELTELDLSENTSLKKLSCRDNKLTKLTISGCDELVDVDCTGNQLTKLDIGGSWALNLAYMCGKRAEEEVVYDDETGEPIGTGVFFDVYRSSYGNWTEEVGSIDFCAEIKTDSGVSVVRADASQAELATAEVFPDGIFRAVVLMFFDTDHDLAIDEGEMEAVAAKKTLLLSCMEIASLKGIEAFAGLTKLVCSNNALTELDISGNKNLVYLDCTANQITELDVREVPVLNYLAINVTPDDEWFIQIYSDGVWYDSVAVFYSDYEYDENCGLGVDPTVTIIKEASASEEEIQATIAKFPDAVFRKVVLFLYDTNKNGALDVREMDAIAAEENLFLNTDSFEHFGDDAPIGADEKIESLAGVEYFTNLTWLSCSNRGLKSLDVSNNALLEKLHVFDNELTELDLSSNTAMVELYCKGNEGLTVHLENNGHLRQGYLSYLQNGKPEYDGVCYGEWYEEINGGLFYRGITFSPDATFTYDPVPEFKQTSMKLTSDIRLGFHLVIPEGFDMTDAHVTFYLDDAVWKENAEYEQDANNANARIYYCSMNPLQFGDEFKAVLYWNDDKYQVTATGSGESYCNKLMESPLYNEDEDLMCLVDALRKYSACVKASGWTDGRAHSEAPAFENMDCWSLFGYEAILAFHELDEKGARAEVDLGDSAIDDVLISVTLEENTTINLYVLLNEGLTIHEAYANMVDRTDAKTETIGGKTYYVFAGEAKGPAALDEKTIFKIETAAGYASISASPMSYVYSYLKAYKDDENKKDKCLAMVALYNYMIAAQNYAEHH